LLFKEDDIGFFTERDCAGPVRDSGALGREIGGKLQDRPNRDSRPEREEVANAGLVQFSLAFCGGNTG